MNIIAATDIDETVFVDGAPGLTFIGGWGVYEGERCFRAVAWAGDATVASLRLSKRDEDLVSENMWTNDDWQRREIMTRLFDLSEEHLGMTIVTSGDRTPVAKAFWAKRAGSVSESADEDAYLAKHKTGSISSSAYKTKAMPSSMHLYPVEACPVVIGTMPLKTPVDGLAGTSPKGTAYKELYAQVRKVQAEVAAMPEGPDGIHLSTAYPEWFRDVYFTYDGKWLHLRCHQSEVATRKDINEYVTRHLLAHVYHLSADDVGHLLDRPDEPTVGIITFRQSGEINQYVAHSEDGDIRRDAKGTAVMMTPEEIKAKGLPVTETTVYAYDGPHCVGYACNEFGAVGVYVEQNYQRQGIGKELLRLYLKQYPREVQLGQMTPAGERLTRSYYRQHVAPTKDAAVFAGLPAKRDGWVGESLNWLNAEDVIEHGARAVVEAALIGSVVEAALIGCVPVAENLRVAMRIDGSVVRGGYATTHFDVLRDFLIKRYLSPRERRSEDRWQIAMDWLENNWDAFHRDHKTEDGFVDDSGVFHSREDAVALLSPAGRAHMKKEGRDWVDSQDVEMS